MVESAETIQRQEAMKLYLQGMKVSEICRQLSRSRVWFYKWLRRYQSGSPTWYKELSKAPHTVANKTPVEIVELILRLRKDLEETKDVRNMAKSIQSRLIILGWDSLSIRTINRILKQHYLTCKQWHVTQNKQHRRGRKKTASKSEDQPVKQLSLF